MKVIKFISNHKIVSSAVVLGAVYIAWLGVIYSSSVDTAVSGPVLPSAKVKVIVAEPVIAEPVITEPEPVKDAIPTTTPGIQNALTNERAVLSIREYAEMYLNLGSISDNGGVISNYTGQRCFDELVAAHPDRFTEDVRERNIKGLSVYASPCATGYGLDNPGRNMWESQYPNGSFFDSDLAKSKW